MKKYPIFALIFLTVLTTSCAVYKPMELSSIVPGNVIRVTMKDGEEITYMKVSAVDPDKIAGDQVAQKGHQNRILMLTDIKSADKQKISALRTVEGAVITAAGVATVAIIYINVVGFGEF